MIKLINITEIQNGKQALICLHFVFAFISYIFVSVSPFEWRIYLYTIDSCWYRQLIPLTHVQNARVILCSVWVQLFGPTRGNNMVDFRRR